MPIYKFPVIRESMSTKSLHTFPAYFLIIMILIVLAVFSVTLAVILGVGYILSLIVYSFNLFQATTIVIGIMLLVSVFFLIITVNTKLEDIENSLLEDEEDDDEEDGETENLRKKLDFIKSIKVGRNQPCPCGSGKKAKFCCMTKD